MEISVSELAEVVITAPDPDWLLDLTRQLKASHPYEVPGISTRPIVGGNPDYLS
jgi:uncharacterized protein involved in tolerance to divalent cations